MFIYNVKQNYYRISQLFRYFEQQQFSQYKWPMSNISWYSRLKYLVWVWTSKMRRSRSSYQQQNRNLDIFLVKVTKKLEIVFSTSIVTAYFTMEWWEAGADHPLCEKIMVHSHSGINNMHSSSQNNSGKNSTPLLPQSIFSSSHFPFVHGLKFHFDSMS